MSPLTGLTGYGGGATGITIGGAGGPKIWYGDRGMFCGGMDDNGDRVSDMNYVDVTSTGNASDFGNLRSQKCQLAGAGGGGRGMVFGGERGPYKDEIDYWAFSTLGNASDFGNLSADIAWGAACSNGTTAYYFGGKDNDKRNEIEKVTIATTGNATAFSGLLQSAEAQMGACADASRGVKCGGASSPYGEMDYVTFDNEGNAVDFGNLTQRKHLLSACSNETIGLIVGGWNNDYGDNGARSDVDKITIQTTANASSFSSFSGNRWECAASNGNESRALGAGGKSGSNNQNSTVEDGIYYWGYASGGGSGDFGDLQEAVHETPTGMSGD